MAHPSSRRVARKISQGGPVVNWKTANRSWLEPHGRIAAAVDPSMTLVIERKGHRVQHVDNASHLAFLVTPGRGLSGRLDYACGWPSSDCWLGGGSVISVPPWPSLVVTKLDAMYWPRSAMLAA